MEPQAKGAYTQGKDQYTLNVGSTVGKLCLLIHPPSLSLLVLQCYVRARDPVAREHKNLSCR